LNDQLNIISFDKEFHSVAKRLENLSLKSSFSECSESNFSETVGIVVRLGVFLDADALKNFPRLSFVASVTTGLDHIDQEYCAANAIKIISLKGERQFLNGIHATPEHTWGLLLALIRGLPAAYQDVREGYWRRSHFFGEELFGKRLGIIGCGRVGRMLATYACAFGMQVQAFDKESVELAGVEQSSLSELLEASDIICCCLTLDKNTVGFIGEKEFRQMKRKPWFINTARGQIVDEGSFLAALESGQLKGAAIDVIADEATDALQKVDSALVRYSQKHKNLIITPHIAGSTYESMRKTSFFIEDKIISFLSTELGR
jgi:D-3-phosphoglycerate dehydrogenase